ncbi:DUF1566 domain-containing protein [bacterium]|nr:DUF1566 domain-containing protein [bacterium]
MTHPRSIIIALSIIIPLLITGLAKQGLFARSQKGAFDAGENHALIIGISRYDKLDRLASPSKDAEEIARILTSRYNFKKEHVSLLTERTKEKPTRKTIIAYLDRYMRELTSKDNLLVFFSGRSTEDDKGETYWIPKDGREKRKMTLLKHSDLCSEYFASPNFKAKNVIIIADSLFSGKLLKSSTPPPRPHDLRYSEKIREKASRNSREVMMLGDRHWPGRKNMEGFGLFTYYFRKALMDNRFKVIDFENLIFRERIIFPIRKIAGTRMKRGRLKKTSLAAGGQFVITRVKSLPKVDIVAAKVNPKRIHPGDKFIVDAKTSGPAYKVYIELDGKMHLMAGRSTEWHYVAQRSRIGNAPFRVIALNGDDIPGKGGEGLISVASTMVNVVAASVSPKEGLVGQEYMFTATTDAPTGKVALVIGQDRFYMMGSDTTWSLRRKINSVGSLFFSVIAEQNGHKGLSKLLRLVVKSPLVNVVAAKATPERGHKGEEFLITARTDRPARAVFLKMGGVTYRMEGKGRAWRYRTEIVEIGRKSFTVMARNEDDVEGDSRAGKILVIERPVPEVAAISMEPREGYAGDNFVIKVRTTEPAAKVLIGIADRQHPMEGTDKAWKHVARIEKPGVTRFRVTASNKDGKAGEAKEGAITTITRPTELVHVTKAEVMPKEGYAGGEFTFRAETDRPARGVTAVLGKKRHRMSGSGTKWILKKKITDRGSLDFYVVAENKDGKEGGTKAGLVVVRVHLVSVVEVKSTPEKGYTGDEFLITAKTDRPASAVYLRMDDVIYRMEGSRVEWRYRKVIGKIGRKAFTVTARNEEGAEGDSKVGEIQVVARSVPEVAAVAVEPPEAVVGDSVVINVKTTTAAAKVLIEIGGQKHDMEGAGTEWHYLKQMDKEGTTPFVVIASNERGQPGRRKEGRITTKKRPVARVNVVSAEVNPDKGYSGSEYTFTATTDKPATGVSVIIGGDRYTMSGSGTEWSLAKRIETTGDLIFSMIAMNENVEEGGLKTGTFFVEELRDRYRDNKDGTVTDIITGEVKKRFVDNRDGTVTDLGTNLMWLKGPKRVAERWEKAEEYCRNLKHEGHKGWRLPTVEEWEKMLDRKQQNPALPPGHPFSNVLTQYGYWSKTRHTLGPLYVYQVDLWRGKTGYQSKKKSALVWPVRYAELK